MKKKVSIKDWSPFELLKRAGIYFGNAYPNIAQKTEFFIFFHYQEDPILRHLFYIKI
jgi:hypothetical protein